MSEKKDQILVEYSSIRDEINLLNAQAFTTVTGSLTFNFVILGWMFASNNGSRELLFLPFIAVLILIIGNLLILHKIRDAHSLALYQKYFIERELIHIKWATVCFDYIKKL